MARQGMRLWFSVTADDCEWAAYRGSGKGGQKRNKTSNAMRCVHPPSEAVGECEEQRSQLQNKKLAFKRMTETKEFQAWLKLEIDRRAGKVKLEVQDGAGNWVEGSWEGK